TAQQRDKLAFIEALREVGSVTQACEQTENVARTMYRWRHADPVFADAWDAALDTVIDIGPLLLMLVHKARVEGDVEQAQFLVSRADRLRIHRERLQLAREALRLRAKQDGDEDQASALQDLRDLYGAVSGNTLKLRPKR